MKTYLKKSLLLIATAIAVVGCDADISGSLDTDGDPGSADFSTFVAIGDSLTAGYADGALYRQIQENSLPNIMAQQFMLAGGGAFTQPLMMPEKTGSLTANLGPPVGIVDLGRIDRQMMTETGDPDLPAAPSDIVPAISSDIIDEAIPGLYNNVGVPGAKIVHASIAGYGNPAGLPAAANPYFVRFASTLGASMLSDATDQSPSFFMFWLGNNDLLLYATDGADGTVNGESVTPLVAMTASFDALLLALKTANNKAVVINVPDVTTIPYFTTVPYNAIPLDAATALELNASLAAFNNFMVNSAGLSPEETARRQLSYSAGQNPVLIVDENLTPIPALGGLSQARPATAQDFIVLPASKDIGNEVTPGDPTTVYGVGVPLVDKDVLTEDEVRDEIETVRIPFNMHVEAEAAANPDLLFFDADAKLMELNETGILYGSGGVSSTFAQGGFYSLDGIHPTARGNAVIANEIFKLINAGFGAYIPPVDPNQYTTVFYQ